jgi:hypothetical protein
VRPGGEQVEGGSQVAFLAQPLQGDGGGDGRRGGRWNELRGPARERRKVERSGGHSSGGLGGPGEPDTHARGSSAAGKRGLDMASVLS